VLEVLVDVSWPILAGGRVEDPNLLIGADVVVSMHSRLTVARKTMVPVELRNPFRTGLEVLDVERQPLRKVELGWV
jgi:hypothetical protein